MLSTVGLVCCFSLELFTFFEARQCVNGDRYTSLGLGLAFELFHCFLCAHSLCTLSWYWLIFWDIDLLFRHQVTIFQVSWFQISEKLYFAAGLYSAIFILEFLKWCKHIQIFNTHWCVLLFFCFWADLPLTHRPNTRDQTQDLMPSRQTFKTVS